LAGAELRCEIVTHFDRLEELAAEWNRMWQADSTAEIFQSFPWARAWWSSFGRDRQLCTPVVYEGDRVVLILPLVQQEGTIRFLGAPEADYCDVLCPDSRTAELLTLALNALLQSGSGWTECILQDLPARSRIASHWQELPSELRRLLRLAPSNYCPTIVFDGKRDQIIEHLLAKKHLQRKQRKLSKAGLVTFRHIETRAEAQEHLTQFFQCQKRRCALLAKTSAFESQQMCSFLSALVEQLDLGHEMRLGVLELDGRPLAWSLAFQVNGKFAFYQQTFDVDAGDYAPGEVLLHYLLLYARENVERELDFARGDEFFKSRFATHIPHNWDLYLEPRNFRGRLRGLWRAGTNGLDRIGEAIRRGIRGHEWAFRSVRAVRVWKRRTSDQILQAKRNSSVLDYLLAGVASLFGTSIWSRDVMTLYQMGSGTNLEQPPGSQPADPELEIAAGRFSDLADLSLEHPGVWPVSIEEGRNRLKKGDQAHFIRERGHSSIVAWTGSRNLVDLVGLNQDHRVTFARPALILYECWVVPSLERSLSYRKLLLFLKSEAEEKGKNLLICCSRAQPLLRAELHGQDCWPKYRIIRRRFFHWMRLDSIRALPIGGSNLQKK
jgi:CelD/BcsL family acetyltransferase involved in cellulose biosynthesis